ncbi:hypothetical protein HY29_14835 [Hyphomonas beringensis]|uniref:Uncharacterized protein n=1 Tax=Hyphomonas beringensis TaxID=1280946 RepID=A0A062UCJ3_9PROT|nr:hypothetical protein HY29_14835 [Hyphomonas beringensis]
MLFSLACLTGFMTLVCAPGLIAQARTKQGSSVEEAA